MPGNDKMVANISRGQSVQITGFGIFEPRKRAARKARNPRTGEEMKLEAPWPDDFTCALEELQRFTVDV